MKLEQVRHHGSSDEAAAPILAAFVAALSAYLAFSQKLLGDGDTFWHLATGQFILRTHAVPTADPFGYTTSGLAWHAHEWLAEVLMALSFSAAGWAGVVLLFALATGITLLVLGTDLSRRIPLRWTLCGLFVIFMLLHPLLSARPHVFGWLLLAGWVRLLMTGRGRPPFAALPLMLVWANVHASYMLGLGIAAAFAIEGLLRNRQAVPQWSIFLAACLAVACVTPQGPVGLIYPFQVSGMSALKVIGEWRATSPREDPLFLLFSVGVWGLIVARRRQIDPVRILLLAGLTVMAISHARHQMPFVLVSSLLVAPLLGPERALSGMPSWRWALGLCALLAVVRLTVPFEPADSPVLPKRAIASVPLTMRNQAVFNSYSFGGPLILAGVKPYIDGRADMYGDAFTLDYLAVLRGDRGRFQAADDRWRFRWIILDPRDGLAETLAADPRWSQTYVDHNAVIFVRSSEGAERRSKATVR